MFRKKRRAAVKRRAVRKPLRKSHASAHRARKPKRKKRRASKPRRGKILFNWHRKHPALITDARDRKNIENHLISHSKLYVNDLRLKRNPDINDKRASYLQSRKYKDSEENFSKTDRRMKLSRKDRKRVKKWLKESK